MDFVSPEPPNPAALAVAWRAALGADASKPGQVQPTPSPGAGERVFYESLYRCVGRASLKGSPSSRPAAPARPLTLPPTHPPANGLTRTWRWCVNGV